MARQLYELKEQRRELISDILADDMHGRHIYLLGSAEFGPTNEPVLVRSTAGLHAKFGRNGTLINAFHAIKYARRDNDIYIVKTTGEHSTAYLNVNIEDGEIIEDGLMLVASESNEIFDETEITVDTDRITFSFPAYFKLPPAEYRYDEYYNISRLCQAINDDTKNGRSYVYAYHNTDPSVSLENALYPVNPTTLYMYGGQCGLGYSKDMLYNCLGRTYSLLESYPVDIIVPVDAFLDDIYPDDSETPCRYGMSYYMHDKDYLTPGIDGRQRSFMDQLINFCIVQLNSGIVTNGILGYNSHYSHWSRYLSESDDITAMYTDSFNYNLKCCENPGYSFLVSAVAGDIMYNKGTIIDNGYLAYAALCAGTRYLEGTANIPVSDTIRIWQELSEDRLEELADNGIVAFRHSPLYRTPVAYGGVTAFRDNEHFGLYCNVRMIQMAISYLNRLYQFYVGHDMITLVHDGIITHDTDVILSYIKQAGIITAYNFKIVPYYDIGEVRVYLEMKTNYMVKAVRMAATIDVEYAEEMEYSG